jgi:hypothetical protein
VRVRAALPALLLGTAALVSLCLPSVRLPAHRGAARITEGFRHGRFDARFLVARGPAALVLPEEPLGLVLALSGPARVSLRGGALESRAFVDAEADRIEMRLPRGGRVEIRADAPVRLHQVRLARRGPPPWPWIALVLLATIAGAALALLREEPWALAASLAAPLLASGAAFLGGFQRVLLLGHLDRLTPALVVLLLLASFLPVLRLGAPRGAAPAATRLPGVFGAIALFSCLAQVLLLPQPLVIGDPAAYHDMGGRFLEALRDVRSPDGLGDAVQTLRPYGGLVATGLLYGVLRGTHDDLHTIYVLQALAMAVAVGVLVRASVRLGGERLGTVVGVLAALYATFPVICGIVQPEPFVLLLWCLGLDRLLRACSRRGDLRGFGLAGLCFGLGLALHPQGLWFLLLAGALLLAPFARALRQAEARLRAGAFALGLLPVVLTTAVGEAWARPVAHLLDERHGFWAYTARFPLGFWLFLDSDGWQGPERIDDTRYARSFLKAAEAGRIRGPLDKLAFTAGFVMTDAGASLRTVLRNLHRLFHVPDNPFRRDFLLPYALQVPWHRALVVLFLLAVPLALAQRGGPALLVPFLMLSATYPLYHVFNKYAVPATPFVLLGAALALRRLAADRDPRMLLALALAALGSLLSPADLALAGVPVLASRAGLAILHLGGLAVAFGLAAAGWAPGRLERVAAIAAGLLLIVPTLAASVGDPSWRGFHRRLEGGLRHEIVLGDEGESALARAREAYLLLDLELPGGDPGSLRLEFATGLVVEGRELQPTMPAFGLATFRGGRDPRSVPQWWRTPWKPGMARDGRLAVSLSGAGPARLRGELSLPGEGPRPALSLGQWPHQSVYRLMHDGEYRLPAIQRLSGAARSFSAGRELPGLLGIRAVILDAGAGGATWETVPATSTRVVTGIWARAGRQARAELRLPRGILRLDFEEPGSVSGAAGAVRALPTGEFEGWFVIRAEAEAGRPLQLSVVPLHEMTSVPKYFLPEMRRETPPIPLDWAALPYLPPARILDAEPAPPWKPARIF